MRRTAPFTIVLILLAALILHILSRLGRDKARVRIRGWLMWDQEHPEQIGETRATFWEIHLIHVIEVYSGGRWREL